MLTPPLLPLVLRRRHSILVLPYEHQVRVETISRLDPIIDLLLLFLYFLLLAETFADATGERVWVGVVVL